VTYGCFKPMERFGSAGQSARTVDIAVARNIGMVNRRMLWYGMEWYGID